MSRVAPTYAEFIVAFPAFASVEQGLVEQALDFSVRLLDAPAWGLHYSDAVGLDAAHNLALESLVGASPSGAFNGVSGPLNSASAAGASVSFAGVEGFGSGPSAAWYAKTIYGQKFLRLQSVVIPMGDVSV